MKVYEAQFLRRQAMQIQFRTRTRRGQRSVVQRGGNRTRRADQILFLCLDQEVLEYLVIHSSSALIAPRRGALFGYCWV